MIADVVCTDLDKSLDDEDGFVLVPAAIAEDPDTPQGRVCKNYKKEKEDDKAKITKGATVSSIKELFPLSPLRAGDGGQHKGVKSGRPKGITDDSQLLLNEHNEYLQLELVAQEQMKQREQDVLEYNNNKQALEKEIYELQRRLEEERKNVKDITLSWKKKIEEMTKTHDQEVLEYNNTKRALDKEKSELQGRLEEEKKNVKDIRISWKQEIEEMKKTHEQEVLEHNNKNRALENENSELQMRLQKEQQQVKDITNSWKQEIAEMTKKRDQECERLHYTIEEQNERIKAMKKALQACKQQEANIIAKYNKELLKWNRQSNNQREHISELEKNINELLNRLSKLAEGRLTHENTNITDLSDADRPTKLSEAYSELYDNEWTDAFEELTLRHGFDEQETIAKLLKILLTSFHRCRQITWQRYHTMKEVASTLDIVRKFSSCVGMVRERIGKEVEPVSPESYDSSETSETQKQSSQPEAVTKEDTAKKGKEKMDCDRSEDQNRDKALVKHLTGILTIDQEKQIKNIWRTTTNEFKDEAVKHLYIALLMKFGISSKDYPDTSKYLASCIDLCWKMGVQEKPMHLDTLAEKEDSRERIFDLDKFRLYTKPGKRVAFLVWPAIFLHEGGAMLAKGIAQGCKEIDN